MELKVIHGTREYPQWPESELVCALILWAQ